MKKPNVILMFIDDLGIGDVSTCNSNGKIKTTNIDNLAKEGMKFTDAHSSSAVCTPSRYGLLTGRYPFRSKLKYSVVTGDSMPLIERDRMTIANLFKQNGYYTACIGKWHLGLGWQLKEGFRQNPIIDPKYYKDIPDRDLDKITVGTLFPTWVEGLDIDYSKPLLVSPNDYGFDYFFGMAASLDQPPFTYIENNKVLVEPTKISGEVLLDRVTGKMQEKWQCGPKADGFDHEKVLDEMQEKVLNLIDEFEEKEEPFFIYYPTPAVHGPLLPNKEFRGKSGLNLYADIVLQTDFYVGQITEKLKEKGIFENTVFIVTSDNGCSGVADLAFLEKNGHYSSAIYREHKMSLYEGGHRVPTIISYPDKIEPNSVCDFNICNTDFFATFADLLNTDLPDNVAEDSFSNLKLWEGKNESERTSTVYSGFTGFMGIVKGEYKLNCAEDGGTNIEFIKKVFEGIYDPQKFELFNIVKDPSEKFNIIKEHPDIVKELIVELDKTVENGRSTPGLKQENAPGMNWIQVNWK
ncbi:MAG: hypothetical protein ATN31_10745 [Candidatus Epulonipiscioides saccharophilum]|nr:MAG: hypothetical protein ATN31_10745 [Epulopiscium sp. AS2M-Bin001]